MLAEQLPGMAWLWRVVAMARALRLKTHKEGLVFAGAMHTGTT